MKIDDVEIDDTYAEAFPVKMGRVVVTAATGRWALIAATEATGLGTSLIGCPAEAGIDSIIPASETPDGRPGISIIICKSKSEGIKEQLIERIGECILTAPTTAVFNGLESDEKVPVKLHFFGDGMEYRTQVGGREVYAIPIMGGEFICEEEYGVVSGVAGGNFFIMASDQLSALTAAEVAVDAISMIDGVITPFPGGIVSSGSKVGSNRYSKFMKATTNEKYCPTIKEKVEGTQVPPDVGGMYELVINGLDEGRVKTAMKMGISAAVKVPGVVKISAGNYGGNLGKYKLNLHDIMK